jgi:predicted peroxiredoxin
MCPTDRRYAMFLLLTDGPADDDVALPFVAAEGALADGEDVSIVAMADAVYLLAADADLHAIDASGLPTVGRTVERLRDANALADAVALRDCCAARDIDEADLAPWATMDDESAVARLAADHDTTLSF